MFRALAARAAPGLSLLLLLAVHDTSAAATWTGPSVKVRHNVHGISALAIDGEITAPGFLEGNTDSALGNVTLDWETWRFTVQQAATNGVRLFSVDVDDLGWTKDDGTANHGVVLHPVTTKAIQNTIDAAASVGEKALIIARLGMNPGTVQPDGKTPWPVALDMNMTNDTAGDVRGCTSITESWKQHAVPRVGILMQLLDKTFPGHIAGAHFELLVAGENTYNWQPGDFGWPDYSEGVVDEFCAQQKSNCWLDPATGKLQAPLPVHRAAAGVHDYAALMGKNSVDASAEGFVFTSRASADYNLWLSRNVQDTISRHAAEVKRVSGGNALVMAFYGYINELGDMRVAGGGHNALKEFFEDANIDAAVSPDKYDEAYRRTYQGPWVAMGTADSARLHNKLWIAEDDARTSYVGSGNFAQSCDAPGTPANVSDPALGGVGASCDRELMRRNLFTAAMHGSGLYQFDITLTGWFGNLTRSADTMALWQTIGNTRKSVVELFKMGDKNKNDDDRKKQNQEDYLEPEVAIFMDDESLGHVRLSGAGASNIGPASWLDQIPQDVALLGAGGYRHYLLKDLDVLDLDLSRVKLAILPNAFAIGNKSKNTTTRSLIESRLIANKNITTMFYFAPGVVDAAAESATDPLASISELVGCPLRRLQRPGSMDTEIVGDSGAATFGDLARANATYGLTWYGNSGLGGLSPRLVLDEAPDADAPLANANCSAVGRLIPGRYSNATNHDGSADRAATLMWNKQTNTLLSTSPVTSGPADGSRGRKVLRAIAEQAGAHMWLTEESSVLRGDSIEVSGNGVLLRGGGLDKSLLKSNTSVSLPPRNGKNSDDARWRVRGEDSNTVCADQEECCSSFSVFVAPGTVKFMFVQPCSAAAEDQDRQHVEESSVLIA